MESLWTHKEPALTPYPLADSELPIFGSSGQSVKPSSSPPRWDTLQEHVLAANTPKAFGEGCCCRGHNQGLNNLVVLLFLYLLAMVCSQGTAQLTKW